MLTGGTLFKRALEDEPVRVTVFVYREGARETTTEITVEYTNAAPQASWGKFLIDVGEAMDLQGIDGIYTDNEGYYVARVSSLKDGNVYFVRPTENSALVRSLTTDKAGKYPAWDIVDRGRLARAELLSTIDQFVLEDGPLPPVETVKLPWVKHLSEDVTTAAQVRAAQLAKDQAGKAAKDRAKRARKALRAKTRVLAAIQAVIRPSSVEGLFQGLHFLRAQAVKDADSIRDGANVESGVTIPPPELMSLLALRALGRFARSMPTDVFIASMGLDRAFGLKDELHASAAAAVVVGKAAAQEATAAAEAAAQAEADLTALPHASVSRKAAKQHALASEAVLAASAAAVVTANANNAAKAGAARMCAMAADGEHWLTVVLLNVCNRPGDPPALVEQAQQLCASLGAIELIMTVLRWGSRKALEASPTRALSRPPITRHCSFGLETSLALAHLSLTSQNGRRGPGVGGGGGGQGRGLGRGGRGYSTGGRHGAGQGRRVPQLAGGDGARGLVRAHS